MSDEYIVLSGAHLPGNLWCTARFMCSLNVAGRLSPQHDTQLRRSKEWQHSLKQAVKVQKVVTESQPRTLKVANKQPSSHCWQDNPTQTVLQGYCKPRLSNAVFWTPTCFSGWLTLGEQTSNGLLPPSPCAAPLHPHSTSTCTGDSTVCNQLSSASYLRRFVPSPFFVLSETCCLRMLSSSALRSLPGQAQMRASKHRRPKTCPLGREVKGNVRRQLRWGPAASLNFTPDYAQTDPNLPLPNQDVPGVEQFPPAKIWKISYGPLH